MLVGDISAPTGDTAASIQDTPAPVRDTAAHVASSRVAEHHAARDLDVAQMCDT